MEDQWSKLQRGEVEFKEFLFAKEVQDGKYRNDQNLPKGAIINKRLQENDEGYQVKDKERVEYLIVQGQDTGLKQSKQLT